MTRHACPSCALDDTLIDSLDDNGNQVLHCEPCNYSWIPTPTSTAKSDNAINASGVGKILRRDGLHRDYGQNGPDLKEDGGPGHRALGSAKAVNHAYYAQGTKVVFVDCDDDQTVRLVREDIGDHYDDVIRWEIGNIFILERR